MDLSGLFLFVLHNFTFLLYFSDIFLCKIYMCCSKYLLLKDDSKNSVMFTPVKNTLYTLMFQSAGLSTVWSLLG